MKTVLTLLLAILPAYKVFSQSKDSTAKQLKEVTIRDTTPLVRQEADRIIYDLQADPQSKVSSVLDMMRKVPGLSVDADDNVMLRGSRSYRIFIDGRPSGLMEGNPKEILRSMPASTVKSIEVITTPPAKYDAEGLAGIINIVTNKQTYNGHRGSINLNIKGPVGGPGAGGSFTFKQGKFGVSVMGGGTKRNSPETEGTMKRISDGENATDLYQSNTKKSKSYAAYAATELSYELDSLNLLSGQFNFNGDGSKRLTTQNSLLTGTNQVQQYRLENNNDNSGNGMDATVNYQRGFKTGKNRLLTSSYRYKQYSNSFDDDISFSNTANFSSTDYRQYNAESLAEQTAQLDYTQPINKLTVEGGIKGISRKNKSDFQSSNRDVSTGVYKTDTARSNIFNNRQDILAAYNSYAYKTDNWHIKAGVRVELTLFKIDSTRSHAPLQRVYTNALPTIVASRTLDKHSSLSLSFTKRIQRPSIAELNPFVDRSDPNFVSSGNPYLLPITSDVYELSYLSSSKATINITVDGKFFRRVFNAFPVYDTVTNITTTRQENYGSGRVLKTNMSLNYPVTSHWTIILDSDIRHVSIWGMADNSYFKNSGLDVYIYMSTAHRLKKGWRANADIAWRKGGISLPLGRTNGFVATTFSVSKNIFQSRWTVSTAVNNPFNKYRYATEITTSHNFQQTSLKESYYRRFTFSLNYRFGKLKEEIKKNKRGISNDDLSS